MASRVLCVRQLSIQARKMAGGEGGKGGYGGSITQAGGSFGKMEEAREGQWAHARDQQALKKLKETMQKELESHERQAKHHADLVEENKKRIAELESEDGKKK